ncbi:MAG: hypothetical protein E7192_04035 [Erysipelotrichaceae bacterium]|nr:hypothetical protein [Erysipelotrichaceae bacterium]
MKKIIEFVKLISGLLKLVLLGALMLVLILYLSAVVRPRKNEFPNDTSRKVSGFYALQENSLDILFMGTSHTYYGFNPSVIYERTGLNSYVFAGECQPISVTYHYLVEALKTQKPQLIVLDVFALLPQADTCQTKGIIKVNLEDLKFSQNKVEALKLIEGEDLLQNVLDISIYKERWNQITLEDLMYPLEDHFNENFGYTEGYPVNGPLYVREMYFTDEKKMPDRKELSYLYKIFKLVEENELDMLLVKTPYYETYEEYTITNYIFQEAEEAGFSTINFNQFYDELDFVFDRDGDVWHCNVRGAWKISNMLSDIIFEKYKISISESKYADEYHNQYLRTIQKMFWSELEAENYLTYLKDMKMTFLVNYKAKDECNLTADQWRLLNDMGISKFDTGKNYLAVISGGDVIYEINHNEDFTDWMTVEDKTITISSYDDFVTFDVSGNAVEFNHYGLNVMTYDLTRNELIDRISLDTIWGFEILR